MLYYCMCCVLFSCLSFIGYGINFLYFNFALCKTLCLARLSETAHYSGNSVCVGYPVLCMRFRAKFWMSDLAYAIFDFVYFYHVIRFMSYDCVNYRLS